VTLDWSCGRSIGMLVNSMWGNSSVRATGTVFVGVHENPDVIVLKSGPSHGGPGPLVIYGSLGLPESTSQMASLSLQPFLQGSQSLQTD